MRFSPLRFRWLSLLGGDFAIPVLKTRSRAWLDLGPRILKGRVGLKLEFERFVLFRFGCRGLRRIPFEPHLLILPPSSSCYFCCFCCSYDDYTTMMLNFLLLLDRIVPVLRLCIPGSSTMSSTGAFLRSRFVAGGVRVCWPGRPSSLRCF